MLKVYLIKFFFIIFVSSTLYAQPDLNEPDLLQIEMLESLDRKAPYRISTRIQLYNCEENCNPIELYIDHTTILHGGNGKVARLFDFEESKAYPIIRFTLQPNNPKRLEQVYFGNLKTN